MLRLPSLITFGNEQFAIHQNKDKDDSNNKIQVSNAIELPHRAHGLNNYQHLANYCCIGAYNANAQFNNWLKRFDENETFKLSRTVEHVYQGLMRTCLRNPDRDKSIIPRIVVTTDDIAMKLYEYFPNANIQQMRGELPWPVTVNGRPAVYNNSTDRIKASNKMKSLKLKVHKDDISIYGLESDVSYVALFKDIIRSGGSEEYTCRNWNDWCDTLADLSQVHLKSKKDNFLISPAIYRTKNGVSTRFGKANVIDVSDMLIFDIDEGYLEPEEWNNLFPNIQKVIYSSSGWTDTCHKYRVILHCDKKMSVEEYEHLHQQITNKFEDNIKEVNFEMTPHIKNGYTGIDRSKASPDALFYAPQKPIDGSDGFFEISGNEPLSTDNMCFDVGLTFTAKPLSILVVSPYRSTSQITSHNDIIAKTKLDKALDSFVPGTGVGFATKQKLFAIIKDLRPSRNIISDMLNKYSMKDKDKSKDLAKSLKKFDY